MPSARFLLIFITCLIMTPAVASAEFTPLRPLGEAALDDVQGQSGLAIMLTDIRVWNEEDAIGLVDTSPVPNSIELQGVRSFNWIKTEMPIHVWVSQNSHGLGMVGIEATEWYQDMFIDVENVEFVGEDLGSLHFKLQDGLHGANFVDPVEFAIYLAPLGSLPDIPGREEYRRQGIALQIEAKLQARELIWNYNPDVAAEELRLGNFQIAGSFAPYVSGVVPDAYADWDPLGRLVVGNLNPAVPADYNPAAFYLVTETVTDAFGDRDIPFLRMQLPMQGSMRMETIDMAGADLGPIFIDGMNIHHLQVDFKAFDAPWGP